jgi:streptogramin lyase
MVVLIAILAVPTVYAKTPSWISELVFPAPQQVSAPLAMAIDSERQRYYVVDSHRGKLLSYAADGAVLTDFDAAGALQHPTDMTFARPGKLWVAERERNCLLYIDMNSQQVREFTPITTSGKHMFIGRIACDSDHRLYTCDRFSGRIYALDDNLKVVTSFAPQSGGHFIDFKIVDKQLWALERVQQAVYQFDLSGQQQQRIALDKVLSFPYSLAVDDNNQLYILDRASSKIYHFNATGKYVAQFGKKGSRRGQLSYAAQLMFDWQQRLCVVNQGNDRIEVFRQQQQ